MEKAGNEERQKVYPAFFCCRRNLEHHGNPGKGSDCSGGDYGGKAFGFSCGEAAGGDFDYSGEKCFCQRIFNRGEKSAVFKKFEDSAGKYNERAHIETAFCGGNYRLGNAGSIAFPFRSRSKFIRVAFFYKKRAEKRDYGGGKELRPKKQKSGFNAPENTGSDGAYKERRPGIHTETEHSRSGFAVGFSFKHEVV